MNPTSEQKRIAFGYNRHENRIVINEGQAACVKLIFDYYLQGNSLSQIKAILEGLGIPSPQNKPTWGKQALSNILSNPHYLGSEEYPMIITQEESDNYYDAQIYNLAHKCAFDYIEKHKEDENEEVRLRVLFLRLLLFKCANYGEKQYIYSGEIVRDLSAMSDSKVTKDFLYRRIVAKLRDEGVLIASSSHGYKIPTCVKDIFTYIEQTDTLVSPMLSRIGKCRTLIKKSTDGKMDVLDSKQFSGYKRYFGDF